MRKYFIFIICAVLFSCSQNVPSEQEMLQEQETAKAQVNTECECSDLPTGVMSWDYPIKPGTEEWRKLKNYNEMMAALQIPENVLSTLSTEDLTLICVQYPGYINAFALNSMDQGLDILFADFNGLRELFKREGVSKELLKHYHARIGDLPILGETPPEKPTLGKGRLMVSIYFLEILLSRYQSQDGGIEDYREILQCLVAGYEKQSMYPDFKISGFDYHFFARAHLISKISPQSVDKIPGGKKNIVFTPHAPDKKTVDIINELSYQLIKQ